MIIRNRTTSKNQVAQISEDLNKIGTDPDPKLNLEKPVLSRETNERLASIDLDDDILRPSINSVKIPQKYLDGYNLNKNLVSYKERRKNMKNKKAMQILENGIHEILQVYNIDEDKYNIQLVSDLMNIVEFFMVHDKKLGHSKKEIVLASALIFWDGNDVLLSNVIEYLMPMLKQRRFFGRILSKLYIFFWRGSG